jgi:uncharacterized RDD family membrane protein YckC
MTASRTRALIAFLLAFLLALLVAFVEGGGVARADTPGARADGRSTAASAVQNDWEQDSKSRDPADTADRADASDKADREAASDRADRADASDSADREAASDSADREDEDDDSDAREARDRRTVEKYFDWDKDWRHPFRHLHSDRHTQSEDIVNFGHDSHLPAGQHADSVVSIFGSALSEGDAGDMVAILGNTQASGHVEDSAVAVLGNVQIDGSVDGDVVAVFGNVDLGPHAKVSGDVTAVGGAVTRDPAATVGGDVQSIGGFRSGFDRFRPWVDHCLFYGRPLALAPGIGWAWELAFVFLALYVFIALLFRDAVARCVGTVETQPGMTLVAALLSILLIPIAIVLLCITVIGIAAIPFVLFGAFCLGLFGKAVMFAWLGRRVVGHSGQLAHPAIAVLVGGLIVLVLYLVPVMGFLVYNILGLFGFGAVIYTLILAARGRRAARPSAAPPGGSAGPAPAVGAGPAAGQVPPAGGARGPVPGAASAAASAAAAAAVNASPSATAGADATTAPPSAEGPAAAAAPGVVRPPHFIDPAVAATLPRAGFWIRMAALLLDLVLVGILLGLVHHSSDFELVVLAIYGALMWKLRGTTVGGLVFHLQVIRVDGRPIDWETAIVRALGCFLSLVVAGLGFFWIAFDSGKQAWHDKIAGTAVVRVPRAVPLV